MSIISFLGGLSFVKTSFLGSSFFTPNNRKASEAEGPLILIIAMAAGKGPLDKA